MQEGAIARHQLARLGVGLLLLRRLKQRLADQRRKDHRHEPRDNQRNGHHREDREGVLAGRALGEADRNEAGDRDQRADQHRRGQRAVGKGGGLVRGVTGAQPAQHRVHRGHRVVDQHPERDDQRTQRDAVQVDVSHVHHGEDDGHRQRNGQRHHGAWPHPQADEAAHENDDDGLPQRGHEVVDGMVHRDSLVGDQHRLDADRQVGLDLGHLLAHVLAERQDVAGIAHGDRQADGRLAVDTEHRLRRVGEAASHRGDVTEAEYPLAGDDVHRLDVALGVEGAGHAQEHALLLALDRAGRAHQVLRLQRGDDLAQVQAQPGQPLGGEFDEDLLVLRAHDLDLRHVGQLQQPRARRLDVVAQFAEAEAVGGEPINDAEGVAEVVIEEGPEHALRQRVAHVADVLAHLVPDVGNLVRRRRLLQVNEDRRLPGDGVAAQAIEVVGLLQGALEPLGHLLHGLVHRGTGPAGRDDHRARGDRRVLATPQLEEGHDAGHHGQDHQ